MADNNRTSQMLQTDWEATYLGFLDAPDSVTAGMLLYIAELHPDWGVAQGRLALLSEWTIKKGKVG